MLKASHVYSKIKGITELPPVCRQAGLLRAASPAFAGEKGQGDEVNLIWSPENNRHEAGASRQLKNLDS